MKAQQRWFSVVLIKEADFYSLKYTLPLFPLPWHTRAPFWWQWNSSIHHSSHLWSKTNIYQLELPSLFSKSCFVLLCVKKKASSLGSSWAERDPFKWGAAMGVLCTLHSEIHFEFDKLKSKFSEIKFKLWSIQHLCNLKWIKKLFQFDISVVLTHSNCSIWKRSDSLNSRSHTNS